MKNSAYVTEKDRHADADSMEGNEDGIVSEVNRIEEPLSVPAPLRENNSSFLCKRRIFNLGEALLFQNHSRDPRANIRECP